MVEWARTVGIQNGIVVIKLRSDKGRVTLVCERSGDYRPPKSNKKEVKRDVVDEKDSDEKQKAKRRRITGSKKCNSPFKLMCREAKEGGWTLRVICGVHNHPVSTDLTGHAFVARLTKEQQAFVDGLCDGNSRPKDVLHKLKDTFNGHNATMKTLYNYKTVKGLRERAEKSQMQYLMTKLVEYDYRYYYRRDEQTDTITDLFYAHPTSVNLLLVFPNVLLIDCTYKTNMYKMPLMKIVGVTSTACTFQVACAFLEKEKEENYMWACNRLKSLMNQSRLHNAIITDRDLALMKAVEACFPTSHPLLCRWHISKNITANCKKMFRGKEAWDRFMLSWNVLMLAEFEWKFNELLARLQGDFVEYPRAIEYVMQQWVAPYKQRFSSAWTNNVRHFGNSTTSRAESQHSVLKKQLGSSMSNFETCWVKIHTLLEVSHTEIQSSFQKSINVVQYRFKSNVFKQLRGVVSIDGMHKILEELKGLPNGGIDQVACGCVLRKTCGLPCAHELFKFVSEDKPIPLELVDTFWRKLDMCAPDVKNNSSVQADLIAHLEDAWAVVKSNFVNVDEAEQRLILSRIREVSNPITMSILTPDSPVVTRGRPPLWKEKKIVDTSTKCNKSGFEYATSYDDSCSPIILDGSQQSTVSPVFSKLPVRPKILPRPGARTRGRTASSLDWLPGNMHDYVVGIEDVIGDGYCGFRVVAAHVLASQDSYTIVRADLLQELKEKNQMLYTAMFGESIYSKLENQLYCFEELAPKDNWFDALDMCYMVANYYGALVIVLNPRRNSTYFPLTKEMTPEHQLLFSATLTRIILLR